MKHRWHIPPHLLKHILEAVVHANIHDEHAQRRPWPRVVVFEMQDLEAESIQSALVEPAAEEFDDLVLEGGDLWDVVRV
jgi:hypothetical protein